MRRFLVQGVLAIVPGIGLGLPSPVAAAARCVAKVIDGNTGR